MGTLLTYTNIYTYHLFCVVKNTTYIGCLFRGKKTHSSALHYTAKISFHLGFCLQPNRLSKRKAQVLSFHFDLQDCIIYTVYKQLASFSQDKKAKGAYWIITADRGSPIYTHNDTQEAGCTEVQIVYSRLSLVNCYLLHLTYRMKQKQIETEVVAIYMRGLQPVNLFQLGYS